MSNLAQTRVSESFLGLELVERRKLSHVFGQVVVVYLMLKEGVREEILHKSGIDIEKLERFRDEFCEQGQILDESPVAYFSFENEEQAFSVSKRFFELVISDEVLS